MVNNLKYNCLFGGGAIRGLAYIGAIRALEELNITYNILGGSSVGSIFATLWACGYKSYELENIFIKVNFELFKDFYFKIGQPFALSKGELFLDWLNELISKNFDKNHITFKDLSADLVIITTNLNTFATQEFSKYTTPDFEIAKAIRISSCMPGLMPPYKYKNGNLVDGDLQKASPMWRLSDTVKKSSERILEFRLEGDVSEKDDKKPLDFINTIYSCVTDVATEFVTELYGENDKYDYLKIGTGNIFFADFNLNKDERRKLINNGYEQTMNYFKNVLPKKKELLSEKYSEILKYLKKAFKGLRANDVEEVQWWLGHLFMILCENKEIVDPIVCKELISLKNKLRNSSSKFMIFYTKFSNRKLLENYMQLVIENIEERVSDLNFYTSNIL